MDWPDPSPARSLSLVVVQAVEGDLVIKERLVLLQYGIYVWSPSLQVGLCVG